MYKGFSSSGFREVKLHIIYKPEQPGNELSMNIMLLYN